MIEKSVKQRKPAEPAVVPCKYCNQPTRMTGTYECDSCWEFAGRIDRFLRTANQDGIQLVADAIKTSGRIQEIRRCLNH